jgi:hypothetical protein
MIADYPTRGRRFWLFISGVAALGFVGVVLMLSFASE